MRKTAPFIIALLICCLLTGRVHAAVSTTPQGAAELKKLVEDDLQWRLALTKTLGQGIAMAGALTVTPEKGFYMVRLDKTSLNFGPEGRLEIGTVVFHAAPGRGGAWLASGTLPASMTFYDKTGAAAATLSIGKQRFAGAWQPAREMWPRFDAFCENIRVKGLKAGFPGVNIGTLAATMNLKDNGDGTWSGPSTFKTSGVTLDIHAKPAARIRIADITGGTAYERLDMSQALAVKKTLREIFAAAKPPTQEEIGTRLGAVLAHPAASVDSMNSSFEMQGFALHQDATEAQPPVELSLGKLALLSNLQDARQQKAKASFKGSFEELKASVIPADFAGLAPQALNLEITADNLPVKKIMEVMAGSLTGAQADMKDVIASLPKILQDNGMSLSVQNSYAKSADLSASLTGKIDANAAAALGFSGKMTLSLKGLEVALQKLRGLAVRPGADLQMMGVVNSLTVLQMMGHADKADDVRVYDYEVTPDGKVLLNGVDTRALAALLDSSKKKALPAAVAPATTSPTPVTPSPSILK